MTVYLIETNPLNEEGVPTQLNFASGLLHDAELGTELPYSLRLRDSFSYEVSVFPSNTPGESQISVGSVVLNNADGALDYLRYMGWGGRKVRVLVGEDRVPYAQFRLLFTGSSVDVATDRNDATLSLRDNSWRLVKPLQANKYLGTGGVEGGKDVQGRLKPLCFALCRNVSPVLVNSVTLLYQYHDGPVEGVIAVYDDAVPLTFVADYSDFAALTSAKVGRGGYATCRALGLMRLGAPTAGVLTLDVRGQFYSAVNMSETIRQIILARTDLTTDELRTADFVEFAEDLPGRVSGLYYAEPTDDVNVFLENALGTANAFWFFGADGLLRVRKFKFRTPSLSVGEGLIKSLSSQFSPKPVYSVVGSYARNLTVQDANSFSLAAFGPSTYLGDEILYVQTDSSGNGGDWSDVSTTLHTFLGDAEINSLRVTDFSEVSDVPWAGIDSDGKVVVSQFSGNEAFVDLRAGINGQFSVSRLRVRKILGSGGSWLKLSAPRRVFLLDERNTPSTPGQTSQITLTGANFGGSVTWSSVDNLGNVVPLTGSGNSRTLNVDSLTPSSLLSHVDVRVEAAGGLDATLRILVLRKTGGLGGISLDWDSIADPNGTKPANNATVGAPLGTYVGEYLVDYLIDEIRDAVVSDTVPPGVPTALDVQSAVLTQSGSTVARTTATWTAPSDEDVSSYDVDLRTENGDYISFATSATRYGWDLPANVQYGLRVRARDKFGNAGPYTPEIVFFTARDETPPGAPTNVITSAALGTHFLAWTNPTASDLSDVVIYENSVDDFDTSSIVTVVYAQSGRPGSWTRSGLNPKTKTYYWLRARDTSGNLSSRTSAIPVSTISLRVSDMDDDSIPGGKFKAGTILASRIGVGDATNYVRDPEFRDDAYWKFHDWTVQPAEWGNPPSVSSAPTNSFVEQNIFSAMPTETSGTYRILLEGLYEHGFNGLPFVRIVWLDQNHVWTEESNDFYGPDFRSSAATSAGNFRIEDQIQVPDAASYAYMMFSALPPSSAGISAAPAGWVRLYSPRWERANAGKLIVDGSIFANHVALNTLTGDNIRAYSLEGSVFKTNTSLPATITVGATGVTIADSVEMARNAGSVTLEARTDENQVFNSRVARTNGTNWNPSSLVTSVESYSNGCIISGRLVNRGSFLGLSASRTTDNVQSWYGFSLAWHWSEDGNWYTIVGNGNTPFVNYASDGYSSTDVLSIEYDGTRAKWLRNGVVVRELAISTGLRFYAGVALYRPGVEARDIRFVPSRDVSLSDTDPAARINTAQTLVSAGKVSINGEYTLLNWKSPDSTEINGGAISSNSVRTSSLYVGARGVTFQDLYFEKRMGDPNAYYSSGAVFYTDDNGARQVTGINAGSVPPPPAGNYHYIFWVKGTDYLQYSIDWGTATGTNSVHVATHTGGNNIVQNYGGTIVNGQNITTGSINAVSIQAHTITSEHISVGSLLAESIASDQILSRHVAANQITAAHMNVGTLSAITATIGLLRTAAQGARLEIESNVLRVYDGNNVLRVRLGIL